MKNHIVIKFVAILLCTLTLLSCITSVTGLYIMTEADLYNKTADQVRDDLIWDSGEAFAREAALNYASQALGGCPEAMVVNHFGYYGSSGVFRPGRYSYSIQDEEGQEVFRQGDSIRGGTSYSFPVSGQYLHLIFSETEQEKILREAEESRGFYGTEPAATINGVEIPSDGIAVTYASFVSQTGELLMEAYYDGGETTALFCNAYGNHTNYFEGNRIGFLMLNQEGYLVFRSNLIYPDMMLNNTSIMEANFFAPGDVNLQLRDETQGVGYLYCDALGAVCFTSLDTAIPEETEPELPDVQAPEGLSIRNVPGLTDLKSSIEDTYTTIALAAFYGPDDTKLLNLYDPAGVGILIRNEDGGMSFLLDTQKHQDAYLEALKDVTIAGVFFQDASGEQTYRAACVDGVGTLAEDSASLIWNSGPSVALPAEAPEAEETEPATEPAKEAETDKADEETSEEENSEEENSEEENSEEENSEEENSEKEESQEEGSEKEASQEEQSQTEASEEEKPEEADSEEATEDSTAPAETTPPVTEETIPPTQATVPPTEAPTVPPEETVAVTEPVILNGKPLEEYKLETDVYWNDQGQQVYASYVRLPMPEYTVVLQLAPNALQYEDAYTLLNILRDNRKLLLPSLAISLLLFAICAVYLCTAAGKKPKSQEIRAGGLNRLPLDLYFAIAFCGIVVAANVGIEGIRFRLGDNVLGICILVVSMAFLACLLLVAFVFALVAQIRTPGGFWYRNTLCVQSLRVLLRLARWLKHILADKVIPFSWKFLKAAAVKCWKLCRKLMNQLVSAVRRFLNWTGRILHRFLALLPITWQWLLAGCVIIFIAALTLNSNNGFLVIFGLLIILAIILYGAHCFGVLSESTRKMGRGDLNTKVDDTLLLGCFKEFSADLNDLADVAVVAARNQLRSERMKTELITNVSHDIKTPLTSIINYVDLLQKSHTEEEREQYLEVLDRQSQRLKKLIDDLMEMSKASTGNMNVDVTTVDAVESVNQALGEFSDKLAAAQLTPVFRHASTMIPMAADGKLVWRVLSNLLSNAVKYAMPGTRLYIDLMELEGKVILSLKNISREELNMDAEELMERFVRGDDSRNTEGSGLGLNIAKSLMELQRGQLQLLVDGDLFKVTLIFPSN